MQPLDPLRAGWILLIFGLVFSFLPAYLFSHRESAPATLRFASNFIRALALTTCVSVLLARLKIFNATTVVALFLGVVLVAWICKRARSSQNWLTALQEAVIGLVRLIENRSNFVPHDARSSESESPAKWRIRSLLGRELLASAFAVVIVTTALLNFAHPLLELRLDQPEQYDVLLRSRELMLSLHAQERPIVFPSMVATVAFLSSADPMQVVRFLSPTIGIFVVLAAGLLIRVCTRGAVAVAAGIYALGTTAFQLGASRVVAPMSMTQKLEGMFRMSLTEVRRTPECEIGLLCLLLALAFLGHWRKGSRGWDCLIDAGCCLVLVGVVSKFLLLICAIAAGAVLMSPVMGIVVFVLSLYGGALAALFTNFQEPSEVPLILPVAAVLGACALLALIETKMIATLGKSGQVLLLGSCVAVAMVWFRPHLPGTKYLEYDKTASETEIIAERFPRQTWVVVAPTEQLAETLGVGGYEDLAEYVGKYQNQASDPQFRITNAPEDLFIYVEKKPFQFFSREPEVVPAAVLMDSTYQSYRSPAGRASLESAALEMCESYRQTHHDTNIFFEDENILIYHIHRDVTEKAGG